MTKYDRQLVVVLLDNNRDAELRRAGDDLAAKAAGKGIPSGRADVPAVGTSRDGPWNAELTGGVRGLTGRSRLYLVGTGAWPADAVSGWRPADAAAILAGAGLTAVGVISIVADEAGRDTNWSPGEPLVGPGDSFAARFHRLLGEQHRVRTEVLARVYPVVVVGPDGGPDRGRKQTRGPDGAAVGHRAESKLRFTWDGDCQVRAWVDYDRGG